MVAISMYRGNLHRVPDVPRRWPIPPHPFPLSRFKSLLSRRASSLSRRNPSPPPPTPLVPVKREPVADDSPLPSSSARPHAPPEPENGAADVADVAGIEISKTENAERKVELEKRLSFLNEKKHHLVLMLKQILNAEEETKRRIMLHSSASRSSVSIPTETSLDQGPVGRHAAPRLTVDVGSGIDSGGESELASNQYSQIHLSQIPCASPSASLGRPFHGSFQRNLAFQNPRGSPRSGTVNTQPATSMLGGGGSMTASPRLSSGQQVPSGGGSMTASPRLPSGSQTTSGTVAGTHL